MNRVLVARTDGLGDVLLAGPAVRAIAASGNSVTMLASPAGAPAAWRLPGVFDTLIARLPWIDAEPEPVDGRKFDALVSALRAGAFDRAVIFTSFHQSSLPLALACKIAHIRHVAAISDDYPGSLLDVRHHAGEMHEVERNLSLARATGYGLPPGDDGRLAITTQVTRAEHAHRPRRRVVVHPGASVPARTLTPRRWRAVVGALAANDVDVVVTGGSNDVALTRFVTAGMPARVHDQGGISDFDGLAETIAGADAIVVGNTGPAHIAAAVGTPVVSIFPPTVPLERWAPWMVPSIVLGDQHVACAGCRARACPVAGQPCLAAITPTDVVGALAQLLEASEVAR